MEYINKTKDKFEYYLGSQLNWYNINPGILDPGFGNNINPVNWGSGYTFTLINADTGDEVGVVTSNSWFNYAKNNANEQIGWEATFDNLPAGNYKLKLKESVAVK